MEITVENIIEIIAGIALIAAWVELGRCKSEIYIQRNRRTHQRGRCDADRQDLYF